MPLAVRSALGLVAEEVVGGSVAGHPREARGQIVGGSEGGASRRVGEVLPSAHRELHLFRAQGGDVARMRVAAAGGGVEGPAEAGRTREVERGVAALRGA